MLEVRHLVHAVALAEHRNFARAADSLNLSQPALSRSIQALEGQLGLRLFDRGRKGVEATEGGQLLLKRARVLIAQMDDLEEETSAVSRGRRGEIRISAGPYAAKMIVGPAVGALVLGRGDLKFRIHVDSWSEARRKLRDREVDLALCDVTELDEEDYEVVPMIEHQAYPVVRPDHPLAGKSGINFSQVRQWPHAMSASLPPRVLAPITSSRGGEVSPSAVQCEDLEILMEVVGRSDVVMFSPLCLVGQPIAEGRLIALPCEESWLKTVFGIVKLKGRTLPPAMNHFIQKAAEVDQACALSCEALRIKYFGR